MWLDKLIRRSRLPYPLFFTLMALFLYFLGFPFMMATDNLATFLSEPRWILIAIFGALNGILIIFVFRKFSGSVDGIQYLFATGQNPQQIKDRLLAHFTNRVYWVVVGLWLVLNFIDAPRQMGWWWSYNNPNLVTVYELIETLPCCVLGGMFMYMIPIGMNLAYRDLCTKIPFNREALIHDWMTHFRDFRWLITMTMFGAGVYAVFPPNIWGASADVTTTNWTTFIPYVGIAVVLIAAVLLPHIFFHRLFSSIKSGVIDDLKSRTPDVSTGQDKTVLRRILLLLETGEAEKLKTWLIDIKIIGEVLMVALLHIGLVELLSIVIHG